MKSRSSSDSTKGVAINLPDLIAELLPIARLVSGALESEPGIVDTITVVFKFAGRRVEARFAESRSTFRLKGSGRGRPPGPHPDRLAAHYRAALGDLQVLRAQLQAGETPVSGLENSRWLGKLAFHWAPLPKLKDIPRWLHGWIISPEEDPVPEDDPTDADKKAALRVPLHQLFRHQKPRPIRLTGEGDEPVVLFELSPLDLTWNAFVSGDFLPADVASAIVGAYHAQLSKSRPRPGKPAISKRPLSASYVRHLASS